MKNFSLWLSQSVLFLLLAANPSFGQNYFFENFNSAPGSTFPTGWTAVREGAVNTDWLISVPNPTKYPTLGILGSNFAFCDGDAGPSQSTTNSTLTSPAFNTSAATVVKLEFYQAYRRYQTDSAIVEIFNGTTWVAVQKKITSTPNNGLASEKVTLDVTNLKNPNMRIRFRYAGFWPWFWGVDDVRFFAPPANDVGVSAILSPVGDCGLGTNSQVKVEITNFGSAAQTNIPVKYKINNNATVSGNFTGNLAPGTSTQFTFPTTANLSAPGDYFTSAWTELPGEQIFANDSIKNIKAKKGGAFNLVNFQGFLGTNLSEIYEGWREATSSTLANGTTSNWRQSTTQQTNSFGTVTAALNLYNNLNREWIISPSFLVAPSAGLVFKTAVTNWQFPEPDAMGSDDSLKIMVSTNCGNSWSILAFFNKNSGLTNQLVEKIIPLTNYEGQEIKIGFYGTDGIVDDQEDFDIHIDDIEVKILPDKDISVTTILGPVSGCGVNNAFVFTNIRNTGTQPQTNFPICYTINGGNPICQNFTGTLNPNQAANFSFSPSATLSTPGDYIIKVYSSLSSDGNTSNDTIKNFSFQNLPLINSFPYFQSFETSNGGWIPNGVFPSWALGTPNKTVIQGAGHGTRAYVTGGLGTSSATSDEKSYVESPCISFANLPNPMIEMRVWWHSEFGVDGALLQSSTDGGSTWQAVGRVGDNFNWYNIQPVSGLGSLTLANQRFAWSGGLGDNNGSGGWVTVRNRLKGLGGNTNVKLRIAYGGNASNSGDGFAFDAIRIYEQPNIDVAILNITRPAKLGCGLSDTTRITIQASNLGKNPITSCGFGYRTIGQPVAFETVSGLNIAMDSVFNYTFQSTSNFTTEGLYQLQAWVKIDGDNFSPNDSIKNYSLRRKINLVDTMTFDGFNGNNITDISDEWSEAVGLTPGGTNSGWQNSTPPQTISLGSTTARTNMFSINRNDWLISRGFKVPENGFIYFKAAVTNTGDSTSDQMGSDDKLRIMVSENCGATWTMIKAITKDSNLTRKLKNFRVDLAPFVGKEIRIGFYATTGPVNDIEDYDLHIDDIFLKIVAPNDIGVSSITSPVVSCGLSGGTPVVVRITNFGSQNISNIPIGYRVNFEPPVNEVFTGTILAGATATYTFSTPANLSVSQPYAIKVYTKLSNDEVTVNDTSAVSLVKVIAPFPIISFTGFNGSNLGSIHPGWVEAKGLNPVVQNSAWTNATIAGQPASKIFLGGQDKTDWILSPGIRIGAGAFLNFRAGLFSQNGTGPAQFDIDDSVTVLISTNCGVLWRKIFKLGVGTIPALTNAMQIYSIPLAQFANQEIRVAFRAKDGTRINFVSDLYLDDIEISSSLAQDIGAISIVFPPSIMEKDSTYNVSVRVSNYGSAPVSSFPVTLALIGYNNTQIVPSLNSGQTITVPFAPFTPSSGGNFVGYAYTNLSSDQNFGNDTIYQTYSVVGPVNVKDLLVGKGFVVYPNPTSNLLFVQFPNEESSNLEVNLFGMDGRRFQLENVEKVGLDTFKLFLPKLAPGLYWLNVKTNSGLHQTKIEVGY